MGYTNKELQRRIEEKKCSWSFGELKRRKELEEKEPTIITSSDLLLPKMIVVDGIKNSIMNSYGGVKEFVKGYSGDFFDEERVEWFVKNKEYFHPKVWDFVNDWNICFPS